MDANVLNGLVGNVNTLIANLTATRNVEYPTEDKLRKRAKDLVKKFTGTTRICVAHTLANG